MHLYPISKALYNFMPLIHPFTHTFTHTFTHQRRLAAMQGTNQLVRSNWGLGVLLKDTSIRPRWDRTGNPPNARRQALTSWAISPLWFDFPVYCYCCGFSLFSGWVPSCSSPCFPSRPGFLVEFPRAPSWLIAVTWVRFCFHTNC